MNSFKLFQLAKKLSFFTYFLPFFPSVALLPALVPDGTLGRVQLKKIFNWTKNV